MAISLEPEQCKKQWHADDADKTADEEDQTAADFKEWLSSDPLQSCL
jgi:hypothetical protein